MHVRTRPLVAALCLLLMPIAAHAQEIASSLDQLRVLVRPGDSLTVTDAAGEELRGKVFELSSTCLVMQARGQRHEFSGDDIRRITSRATPISQQAQGGDSASAPVSDCSRSRRSQATVADAARSSLPIP